MRKFFSFSRSQTIVFLTLAFVILVGALYFFIYIPNNQRTLEEQRFRCLQNVESNIKAKRNNSVSLLRTLKADSSYSINGQDSTKSLLMYINNYSKENFKLIAPVDTIESNKKVGEIVTVNVDDKELSIFLLDGKRIIGMRYSVKQFFSTLLPKDNFDEYIILYDEKIIHQTFESGITGLHKDSIPSDVSAFSKVSVKTITLSGTEYKLFSQRMDFSGDKVLTVIGLLNNKQYQDEKKALPSSIVLFLAILAITTILLLPWIKLYQIGSQDRLTAADGILTFPVSMLLMSVIFFVFFKYNSALRPGKLAIQETGKNLADQLGESFLMEVNANYNLLSRLDSLYAKKVNPDPRIPSQFRYLNQGDSIPGLGRDSIGALFKRWHIDEVFWLDNKGKDVSSWLLMAENSPQAYFSDRAYFKHIESDEPFFLNNDAKKPMYLEPIVSWTTGTFTSILSKRSESGLLSAISFEIKCLDKAILPAGAFYCIIDRQGKVLYHSTPAKNLNENVFQEFSNSQKLRESLEAQTNVFFETKYMGKDYYAYSRTLPGLPYHLVTFENKAFKNYRDMNISYFCFFMLLLFFAILIFELLVVFLFSLRKSYFKKHYFDISWIGPNEKFHHQYNLTFLWNLVNIILLLVFFHYTSFLEFLFLLLFSATSVILFLNFQYQITYENIEADKFELKKKATWALAVMLFMIFVAAWFAVGFPVGLMQYIGAMGILALVVKAAPQWIDWIKGKLKPIAWDFSQSFSVMIFSSLIITSGIPMAVFYIAGFDQELKLISRYKHKNFAERVLEQNPLFNNSTSNKNIFKDEVWIDSLCVVKAEDQPSADYVEDRDERNKANILLGMFTSFHSDNTLKINEFYRDSSDAFHYVSENGRNLTYQRLPSDSLIRVSSAALQYPLPSHKISDLTAKDFCYWSFFLLVLFCFWNILHRILRRLFALDLPSQEGWQNIDDLLFTRSKLNSLLFIIGSPGSGKLTKFKDRINKGKILSKDKDGKIRRIREKDMYVADMILIPETEELVKTDVEWNNLKNELLVKSHKLVVINHFEYDIKNPSTNRIKLDLLERLLQKNNRKVVIISTVHPVNFLESLNKQEIAKAEEKRRPEYDLERWHVLLGHFRIIIDKLEIGDFKQNDGTHPWKRIVSDETRYSHFLVKMQRALSQKFQTDKATDYSKLDGESLTAKIGITAHYFYMYVWQSLTKEEKFLLYDLAEDGLVNPYDDYNLTILLSKGLIIRENSVLRLFNEGFRNFILTAIGNAEVLLIKDQIKDNGNWSNLKTPLLILVGAVLVFLYSSQQEAYAVLMKYLGIVSVGIPSVYKLFESVESLSEKAAESKKA